MTAKLYLCRGDILAASCQAVTNTVNCVGVMGKGLAPQFKQALADTSYFADYQRDCRNGVLQTGVPILWRVPGNDWPQWVVNFPTKDDWRQPSRLSYIEEGLNTLAILVIRNDIRSLALPALGCQNGGLQWSAVKPLIEAFASGLQSHRHLYAFLPSPKGGGPGDAAVAYFTDWMRRPCDDGPPCPDCQRPAAGTSLAGGEWCCATGHVYHECRSHPGTVMLGRFDYRCHCSCPVPPPPSRLSLADIFNDPSLGDHLRKEKKRRKRK